MKRRILAFLLTAVMALSLAACGDSGAAGSGSGSASAGSDSLNGYPDHSISWIVCMAAGSGTDLAVRKLGDQVDLAAVITGEIDTGGAAPEARPPRS